VQPTGEINKTSDLLPPLPLSQVASSSDLKSEASRRLLATASIQRTQVSIPNTITETDRSASAVLGVPHGLPFVLQRWAQPNASSRSNTEELAPGPSAGSSPDVRNRQRQGSRTSVSLGSAGSVCTMSTVTSEGSSTSESSSEASGGDDVLVRAPMLTPVPERGSWLAMGNTLRKSLLMSVPLQSIPEASSPAHNAENAQFSQRCERGPVCTSDASSLLHTTATSQSQQSAPFSVRNFHVFKRSTPYTM
jgi:hypothetical protein